MTTTDSAGPSRRDVLSLGAALGAGLALGAGVTLRPGAPAAAAPGRPRAAGPLRYWLPANTSKVLRDDTPDGDTGSIRLRAAGNEYESAQVLLRAAGDPLDVTVSVSRLDGPHGPLPAGAVELFRQHYIQVTAPENTRYPAGWYPDALVPLRSGGTVPVTAEHNQGLWLRVRVPAGQTAGHYAGTLSITGAGTALRIPVHLTVRDFDLPTTTSSPTAFTIWYDQVAWAHGVTAGTDEYAALMDRYYWFQVEQRLFPDDLPIGTDLEPADWAERAEPYLTDERVRCFRIPYYGGDILGRTAQLVGILRAKGLLHKGFFYLGGLIDEPKPAAYDRVRQLCRQVEQIAPEVPHVVTTTPVAALADDVSTWCFPFGHYGRPMTDWVRSAGKHAWWYPLVGTSWPLPSVFIDDSLLGTRLIGWLQHDLGIEGLLYWSTTIFEKWNGTAYVPRDTWTDPTGYPKTNGDGFLLYPGKQVGIDGPVGTVRAEALRDGLEDLEYLVLWESRIAAVADRLGVGDALDHRAVTRPVFDRLYTALDDYTDDPARLAAARDEVARQISDLARGVPALVTVPSAAQHGVLVDVYAAAGTRVRVNGRRAVRHRTAGDAVVWRAALPLPAGTHQLDVELTDGDRRSRQRRVVLVVAPEPALRTVPVNDFETDADLTRMTLNHVGVARSEQYATSGKSSLAVTYPANVAWPGISFDAAKHLGGADWSAHRYLAFDAYNPNDGVPPVLYAKFHGADGSTDDKHPVWFAPGSNEIRIDLRRVTIDRTAVGRLELYGFQSFDPVPLFLDHLRFLDES